MSSHGINNILGLLICIDHIMSRLFAIKTIILMIYNLKISQIACCVLKPVIYMFFASLAGKYG